MRLKVNRTRTQSNYIRYSDHTKQFPHILEDKKLDEKKGVGLLLILHQRNSNEKLISDIKPEEI